ncbi:MAG: helix-turn-helix domain-containing protein [Spirochaetota bacterium]
MTSNRRLLLPFHLSYAVGLIAPIVLGVVLFFRTSTFAEREIDTRVEFALEQAAVDIESVFDDVEFIVTQASLNESVLDLSNTTFEGTTEKYRRLIDLVFNPAFINSTAFARFVVDHYLIMPQPELVLGSTSVLSFDSFYDYVLAVEGVDQTTFFESYLAPVFDFELRRERVSRGLNSAEQAILLLHAPSTTSNRSNRLLFVIDRREIERELRAASFEEGSAIFVLDCEGRVVASFVQAGAGFEVVAPADPQSGEFTAWRFPPNSASYSVASPEGDVQLVAHISRRVFTSRASFVRQTTLALVVVVLLVDVLLVLWFSRRNSRPLSEILTSLQSELESRVRAPGEPQARLGSSLRYLERQLNRVLERKHDLEDELDRQKPVLTSLILQSLVQGIRIRDDELKGLLARSGIALNTGFRCCFVLSFDPVAERVADDIYDEFALKKLFLEELCRKRIRGHLSFLYQSYERLVVLHGADADDKVSYHEHLVGDLRAAVAKLLETADANTLVGVGNPYYTLSKIRTSFEEANISVEQYAPLTDDGFAVYGEFVDSHQTYYFPVELELRLLNATRLGSEEGVRKTMRQIRRVNFEERNLPRESILILFGEIRGTVAKLNASIETAVGEADDQATMFTQQTYGAGDWKRFLSDAEELLVLIAGFFHRRGRQSRSGIDESEVARHIDDNFGDSNMSLVTISEAFGVSEKYFSRYFKERFRLSFHPYLEHIRLSHAREQMLETDLPLREIILRCGYASSVTFSRAFKRKYGVNPSMYRDSQSKLRS